MATKKEYYEYIREQLATVAEVSFRPMMGEYVLYYDGKVIGGLYDDRLLVKPTPGAKAVLPSAPFVAPYEGAKDMLLVEDTEDRDLLKRLLPLVADDLSNSKKK